MTDNINLIGYCGLYCPKCYRMRVSESAKKLQTELKLAQSKGATYIEDSGEIFMNSLNDLVAVHCEQFCRVRKEMKCAIWKCCTGKGLEGCWKCESFRDCDKLCSQFVGYCESIIELGIDGFSAKI